LGNPLDFILTGGQAANVAHSYNSIKCVKATYGLMDKACDADELIKQMQQQGIIPVIPPKSNRKEPREYDRHIY